MSHESSLLERTSLSTQALQFLLDLHDADACQEESIGTLCVLAEELQPGAIVGGTIIDGRSATFDRVCFPACQPRPSARSVTVRLRRPTLEPAHRRCVRKELSSAQTLRLTPVLMPAGVVCTSALGSTRCNPLPYSAMTGRLLVPSSWRSGSHGLPSTRRSRGSACMPCGPFFKNRHATKSRARVRFNLAWQDNVRLIEPLAGPIAQ